MNPADASTCTCLTDRKGGQTLGQGDNTVTFKEVHFTTPIWEAALATTARLKTRGPYPEPMDYSIIVDKLDYGGFITPLLPTEAFWLFGCTRTSTYLTPIVLISYKCVHFVSGGLHPHLHSGAQA